jgi:hypothetical protein
MPVSYDSDWHFLWLLGSAMLDYAKECSSYLNGDVSIEPRRMNRIWFQRNPVPVDWVVQRQIVQRFEEHV